MTDESSGSAQVLSLPGSPPPARTTRGGISRLLAGVIALFAGLIGFGVGAAVFSGDPAPADTASSASPSESSTAATTDTSVPAYTPKKSDFSIKVKVTSKQCFGSAGCSVQYAVDPTYVGLQTLTGSWEVTYEVRGGSDGPITGTIELHGTDASWDRTGSTQTDSNGSALSAVVTEIDAAP